MAPPGAHLGTGGFLEGAHALQFFHGFGPFSGHIFYGRFFRTVPALFLSYLTARSCTDLAFLVATGPTPGLCRGVETGPGVALVWEKWSRRSAETPLQNRFRTLGGPIDGALRDL